VPLRGSAAATLLLAAALVLPAVATAQARPDRLVLATVQDDAGVEVSIAVLQEAYRRVGIAVTIERFAGDVALQRSTSGATDGDVARADGLTLRYPDLAQVPIPIDYTDIAVFARDSALRIRTVDELRRLRVAVVRGVPAIERTIGDLPVRMVDTYDELFALLAAREVDAVVATELAGRVALARGLAGAGAVRAGILDSYLRYHYLHRRHAALVPEVERVLRAMLLDGTVARIRAATVERVLDPGAGSAAR
jgi:polar amino acid transport system substrate-binding protein